MSEMIEKQVCENCGGTGFYGDNGSGIKGNREYVECECRSEPRARKLLGSLISAFYRGDLNTCMDKLEQFRMELLNQPHE